MGWRPPSAGTALLGHMQKKLVAHEKSYHRVAVRTAREPSFRSVSEDEEASQGSPGALSANDVAHAARRGDEAFVRTSSTEGDDEAPGHTRKILFSFLDRLAEEWMKICMDTDEEDWNKQFPDVRRVGSKEDGFFMPKETYEKFIGVKILHEDLLLAFVNARGAYGNSALHMAVTHCNVPAIRWLLDHKGGDQGRGRGTPSLTLLNRKKLTPFTLSVRMAQEKPTSIEAFDEILQAAYRMQVTNCNVLHAGTALQELLRQFHTLHPTPHALHPTP